MKDLQIFVDKSLSNVAATIGFINKNTKKANFLYSPCLTILPRLPKNLLVTTEVFVSSKSKQVPRFLIILLHENSNHTFISMNDKEISCRKIHLFQEFPKTHIHL